MFCFCLPAAVGQWPSCFLLCSTIEDSSHSIPTTYWLGWTVKVPSLPCVLTTPYAKSGDRSRSQATRSPLCGLGMRLGEAGATDHHWYLVAITIAFPPSNCGAPGACPSVNTIMAMATKYNGSVSCSWLLRYRNVTVMLIMVLWSSLCCALGKGCIYSFDPVGSYERETYRAGGSAASMLQPLLDNQVWPHHSLYHHWIQLTYLHTVDCFSVAEDCITIFSSSPRSASRIKVALSLNP